MSHTPGPWRVTTGLNGGYIASKSAGYVPIRTPFREDAFRDGPARGDVTDEELDSNARLIAAAPDLLEACQAIAASSGLIGNRPDVADAMRKVSAAIAKANGL